MRKTQFLMMKHVYIQSKYDFGEASLSPEEVLELKSAQFAVNIRENCKVSQKAMETMMDGVTNLVDDYLSIVMGEIHKCANVLDETVKLTDIRNVCTKTYPPSAIFSTVRSKKSLDKVLKEKFNMVDAEKIVIGSKLIWKRKAFGSRSSAKIRKVNYDGYYVPFLKNLKNLVSNPEVYANIISHTSNLDNVYRTVLDGSFYKNNEFFKNNNYALAIIFYYDDLVVGNPLGVAAKKHKLSMFYWTLANIKPEVGSSLNIIQLYAIVRTEHLKQPNGITKILQPFITDIVKLQTAGVNINVNGEVKNLKGSVIFCAGDTPASAMLGGFKESVAAYRPCRTCMTTKDEWPENLSSDNFILRNKTDHQEYVDVVSDPSTTKAAQEFWKTQYGINKQTPLAGIPFFDTTKCFPQDAMHVLIEGVGEIVCGTFLRYCISVKKIFNLEDLNERIENFDFKHFQNDKPALILTAHLTEEGHLRQSAAQFLVLFHTLPFLIGD